ncbi:hypothetical protein D2Q93_11735 [Alicyclobacillaceae bacterium I2511]|nr:hypothetical protein D2Q93_11735 [Alicyclobacillaceae bacterium I2511]
MRSIEESEEKPAEMGAHPNTNDGVHEGSVRSPGSQPTLNEWKHLYAAAIAFRDLAPWHWMFEDQLFAVVDSDSGEVGYCSVLGSGGEFLALGVYRGEKGLLSYQRISRQDVDGSGLGSAEDPDVFLGQKALMASFEGSRNVDKRDREIFQSLGLRFRGKQSWPVVRSYEPGYMPWFLNARECRFLTQVLEQATLVGQRIKDNPELLDEKPGSILTRVHIHEGQVGKWTDEWRVWPCLEVEMETDFLQPVSQVSELRLKRAMKAAKPSGAWEVDISYAPFSIHEGERPYYPRLMLCVHHGSGMVLAAYPGEHNVDSSDFVEQFVAAMEQHEIYPEQVVVCRSSVGQLLLPVAQAIGAEVFETDYLPGVVTAREGMREFMGI